MKPNEKQGLGDLISNFFSFIRDDIWRIRLADLPFGKSFLIKQLRIMILAIRGFDEDRCLLRASSLTFYTLLSIVPVAAMFFGIAKGFGFEKRLQTQLYERFPRQEEILNQVIGFSNSLLEQTRGGLIAGIGLLVLFWSVLKVLGHIEMALNHIWEIKKPRSWGRKFSDYLSIMLISPILILMSGSATVFITTQVTQITDGVWEGADEATQRSLRQRLQGRVAGAEMQALVDALRAEAEIVYAASDVDAQDGR